MGQGEERIGGEGEQRNKGQWYKDERSRGKVKLGKGRVRER